MEFDLIDSGKGSAIRNMSIDRELLCQLSTCSKVVLHFYEWEFPSITYGYFIDPETYLNKTVMDSEGIQRARRSTGGGIVFHLWDLAFSLCIPASSSYFSLNTLENYAFVNGIVAQAIQTFTGNRKVYLLENETPTQHELSKHYCMAKPVLHDVMLDGKKVAGGAQRRTRYGFLHQGTIAIARPSDAMLRKLLGKQVAVLEDMEHHSTSLLGDCAAHELDCARKALKEALVQRYTHNFNTDERR